MDEQESKQNIRKIADLSEKEFVELMQNSISGNQIEVSGVNVASQKSSLKEIEKCVDRLVKKHKDFLLLRKELQLKTGYRN